jgi:hypothetical protein
MNSSVTFMEKLRKTFDNHPTIRHHMINKNTYVIYWTPLTLPSPKNAPCETQLKIFEF